MATKLKQKIHGLIAFQNEEREKRRIKMLVAFLLSTAFPFLDKMKGPNPLKKQVSVIIGFTLAASPKSARLPD